MKKLPLVLTTVAFLLLACGNSPSTSSTGSTGENGAGKTNTAQPTLGTNAGTPTPLVIATAATIPAASTLLTADIASRLSGSSNLSKLADTTAGGVSEVVYVDQTTGDGVTMLIEQVPGVVNATIMQAAVAQASHGSSGNDVPISGIGDQAFKEVETNSATVVFAKGATLVVVTATGTRDGTAIEADEETVCKQLAGQL